MVDIDSNRHSIDQPAWLVINQSQSPTFQSMLENVARRLGPCLVVSGVHYPTDVAGPLRLIEAPAYDKRSKAARLRSWFRFVAKASVSLLGLPGRPWLLVTTNPPVLPHLAWMWNKFSGSNYVVLVWDVYPDHLEKQGWARENGLLSRCWRYANRLAVRDANAVVTISERMALALKKQMGSSDVEIRVIPNWADTEQLRPIRKAENAFAQRQGHEGLLTVLYSGNVGATHGLDGLVQAARILREDPDFAFLIIGQGMGLDSLRAATGDLTNLAFLDKQPAESFPEAIAAGDIAIVAQAPGTEDLSLPSKTYSALAVGSAIVALTSQDSDLARLVVTRRVGLVAPPNDPQAIARALRTLRDKPALLRELRANARHCAIQEFSERAATNSFAELLGGVAQEREGKRRSLESAAVRSRLKRTIDVCGASLGLALSAPILLGASTAIWATMGRPIFFRQRRPGLHEQPVTILKFRTMRRPSAHQDWFASDAERITRLGRLLRKLSIDELPQLLSVLRGEMSLVGPRPLLAEYLDVYTPRQRRRHEVKPGITGWAQVMGRNRLPLSTRRELDVWYVDNWNLLLDLRILFMTIKRVAFGQGAIPAAQMKDVDDQGFEEALKRSAGRKS